MWFKVAGVFTLAFFMYSRLKNLLDCTKLLYLCIEDGIICFHSFPGFTGQGFAVSLPRITQHEIGSPPDYFTINLIKNGRHL